MSASNSISKELRNLLECPLCLQMLNSPISTACGHTFCSSCLTHALVTSPHCPLCRSSCYLQPQYSRKPVVLVEKLLETLKTIRPNDSSQSLAETIPENNITGEFRLGLFVLNDPDEFCAIPNRVLKLRAFEPPVLLLIRRCAQEGVRFGLQSNFQRTHGLIVRVDQVAPFPDRRFSHHLYVQCFTEGLYELCSPKVEEENTGGLHYAFARKINSGIKKDECSHLVTQAKNLLNDAILKLKPSDAALIFEDSDLGIVRAVPDEPVELSFFLIETLLVPDENILYEPDCSKRLQGCIEVLSSSATSSKNIFRRIQYRRDLAEKRDKLELSRYVLFASGFMVFLGLMYGSVSKRTF